MKTRSWQRITDLLASLTGNSPPFPPTVLFNENWLLRLVLDWYANHFAPEHKLRFLPGVSWFSEAQLPSAFMSRYRGDPLGETRTRADGVVGHILIGQTGKTDLLLAPDAEQFLVLEAKMTSGLSGGVSRVRYFDQAARNVACIVETLRQSKRRPEDMAQIGFFVLAPEERIASGVFGDLLSAASIQDKVQRRVAAYEGEKDRWYGEWFAPTMELLQLALVSWEETIACIGEEDAQAGEDIGDFYTHCLAFNRW